MIGYKIGCNFDLNLVEKIYELNRKYARINKDFEFGQVSSEITEFYGSHRKYAWLAARPDFRLPDVTDRHVETFVKLANDDGISFNYTINTINPGSKRELISKKSEIVDLVKYLENIGVKTVTIGNPILLDIVREVSDTIGIEISTIMEINSVTQIKYLKNNYNINKVCNALIKNRCFKFLKNAADYCNNNNIILELMVNEFCGVGGKNYCTSCIFRPDCYLRHSTNITKEDALSMKGYPMDYCMHARNTDPANWLRTRFIRPEDIKDYVNIGINHFKITGRTGTSEYIGKIAESYLKQKWDGNLLALWKPLETIYTEQKESEFKHSIYINNKKLDGFIKHWIEDPTFDCANEICGETCNYCHNFYKENIKK